mgnify:CR=1 FL=1
MSMVGGVGQARPADDEVRTVVDAVSLQLLAVVGLFIFFYFFCFG